LADLVDLAGLLGKRDEIPRCHQTARQVAPPYQRLVAIGDQGEAVHKLSSARVGHTRFNDAADT